MGSRSKALCMVGVQLLFACAFLTVADDWVSSSAFLVGLGIEALILYWIVGYLFWPAKTAVETSTAAVATDPTDEIG